MAAPGVLTAARSAAGAALQPQAAVTVAAKAAAALAVPVQARRAASRWGTRTRRTVAEGSMRAAAAAEGTGATPVDLACEAKSENPSRVCVRACACAVLGERTRRRRGIWMHSERERARCEPGEFESAAPLLQPHQQQSHSAALCRIAHSSGDATVQHSLCVCGMGRNVAAAAALTLDSAERLGESERQRRCRLFACPPLCP